MGNGEKKGFLTVKEVAKRTGLSVPTLRYYDREGLTPQISRSAGGIRQYTEEDVCWLELICCLKHSGMALSDIRKFVGLCLEGEDGEKKDVLLKQKEHILAQIRQLLCSLELIECKLKHYREIGTFHVP